MRVLGGLLVSLFIVGIALAQAPAPKPAPPTTPAAAKPGAAGGQRANLAQLMRGILFPNSNIIFATQTQTPAEIEKAMDVSPKAPGNSFSGVYTGWQVVENAALALTEAADLVAVARACENGRMAPVQRADWVKFTQGLRDAGRAAYKAAQSKNQDNMVEAAGTIADACESCHTVYREKEDTKLRCTP